MLWAWFFLLIGGGVIWLLQVFSLKDPEKRAAVEASFERRITEPDMPVQMTLRAVNKSGLPIFYLDVMQHLASGLLPADEGLRRDHWRVYAGTGALQDVFYVPRYSAVSRSYPLVSDRRGCYRMFSTYIGVGDFLGVRQSLFTRQGNGELVVIPKRSTRTDLPVTLGNLFGDLSVQRFILEDPILTAGFAEYTGHEPQKAISWTQSARAGRMLVKKYDHTAERTVTVLLNIEHADDLLEECFSLTRSVCEAMEKQRISWGFCTNANLHLSQGIVSEHATGTGTLHLYRVLEGLARADGTCVCRTDQLLERLCRSDVHSAGYLIIQAAPRPELTAKIRALRSASGSLVYLLYAKGGGERC